MAISAEPNAVKSPQNMHPKMTQTLTCFKQPTVSNYVTTDRLSLRRRREFQPKIQEFVHILCRFVRVTVLIRP
jgi:hypothetical protein